VDHVSAAMPRGIRNVVAGGVTLAVCFRPLQPRLVAPLPQRRHRRDGQPGRLQGRHVQAPRRRASA